MLDHEKLLRDFLWVENSIESSDNEEVKKIIVSVHNLYERYSKQFKMSTTLDDWRKKRILVPQEIQICFKSLIDYAIFHRLPHIDDLVKTYDSFCKEILKDGPAPVFDQPNRLREIVDRLSNNLIERHSREPNASERALLVQEILNLQNLA
jgi:hypothetical protein